MKTPHRSQKTLDLTEQFSYNEANGAFRKDLQDLVNKERKTVDIQQLSAAPEELRRAADEIEKALQSFSPGTRAILGIMTGGKRAPRPSPAGARRGVTHPNDLDQAIMKFLIDESENQGSPQIQECLTDDFPGIDTLKVGRSLKWLVKVGKIKSNGKKGRAMAYTNVDDDPALPEKTHSPSGRRNPNGGPTARQAILLVLNELEPGDKITPKDSFARAMEIFPGRFKVASFGAIFSTLAKDADSGVQFEGNNKNRVYFRGADKLEDAATMPEDAPPRQTKTDDEAATG